MIRALPPSLSLLCLLRAASGANPIVADVGQADPHIHVFNNTFYLFSTHDFSPKNTGFKMTDWWQWSSADLVTWTLAYTLQPNQTASDPSRYDECWATDAAVRDGKYYWYLSLGGDEIGVMSSTAPTGPWTNPLQAPLVPASVGPSLKPQTTMRDPCSFVDDDGEAYLNTSSQSSRPT
jgi:arabinoxylan arabinofuranohydrolase